MDRALIDLTTFFRDALLLQLGTGQELVNAHLGDTLGRYATATTAAHSLACIDAIALTRRRLAGNVSAQAAVEALMTQLITAPPRR
jgi:DNA polymerase-3 subunit delta'